VPYFSKLACFSSQQTRPTILDPYPAKVAQWQNAQHIILISRVQIPPSIAGRERGKMAKNLLVQAYYSTLLVTAVMFFIKVALADVS